MPTLELTLQRKTESGYLVVAVFGKALFMHKIRDTFVKALRDEHLSLLMNKI